MKLIRENVYFITILLIFHRTHALKLAEDFLVDDYLADRFEFVQNQLMPHKMFPRETENSVEFHEAKSISLSDKYKSAHTFRLFNKTHLLLDNELFHVQQDNEKFILTAIRIFDEFDSNVQFVKSIDYERIGLMFVAFANGICRIYAYENATSQNVPIQTIKHQNKLTDAKFFINKGFLYLAVTSTSAPSKAPFIVYKWEQAYFDEVSKEFIEGAIALTTFANEHTEMIIVLRNLGSDKANSFVYEFTADSLKKVQVLDNINPIHINSFQQNHKQFLIIFENTKINYLYLWNGHEFVLYEVFETNINPLKVRINYINNKVVILLANNQNIELYRLKNDKINILDDFEFKELFSKVFDVQFTQYRNENVIIVLGLINNYLSSTITSFIIKEIEIVGHINENNELLECIKELETELDNNEQEMLKMIEEKKKIIKPNEPFDFKGKINVSAPVLRESLNINYRSASTKFEEDLLQFEATLNALEEHAKNLQHEIIEISHSNNTVVNGKLIIQGGINAANLASQSIYIKKLNGINWTPEQWLSYSNDQHITGRVFVKNLIIDKIHLPTKNNIFNDILLLNGNQKMSANVKITSLKASNIITNGVNGISLNELYLRSIPRKISGKKTFNNVNVDNIKVELLNGQNASDAIRLFGDPKAFKYVFQPNVQIHNLNVKEINNIVWDNFTDSLFKIGSSQHIDGNLSILTFRTDNLHTNLINGRNASNLLTTTTDQTITSNMKFNNVNVRNIISNNINGLDFVRDVATFGENVDTVIAGPVVIKHVIIKNLIVNGSDGEFYKQNHIVGTNESDLLQIYNNSVKIIGNLHLENVHLLHSAKLFINGNEFNQENFNDYWLKTTNQEIPVHFQAQKGISTPHINTNILNNVLLENYMVNNLEDKQYTKYIFENVTVFGNIVLNEDLQHLPNLKLLEREAVKLNGEYVIKGRKTFNGNVTIDNLKTDFINSIATTSLLTKTTPENFGSKVFENLIVKRNVNVTKLFCNNINEKNLNELLNNTIFIDKPHHINNIEFLNVTANNISLTNINKKLFKEYVLELDQIYLMKVLNKLEIRENVSINNVNNVMGINNVNIPDLLEKVGDIKANEAIKGNITFEGKVHVKNLFVADINGINFANLLPRLYYRHWSQNITARHTFKIITTPHLFTSQINDILLTNLIDTKSEKPQLLLARNGLILNNANFSRSLQSDYVECHINNINTIIPTRYWHSVEIKENVTLWDDNANLNVLLRTAVLSNKDNVITSPVVLNHVFAENVHAKLNINGIDLLSIASDAIYFDKPNQIISGIKQFNSINAYKVDVDGNAEIPLINKIKLSALNESIINKNEINNVVIKGHKNFLAGIDANLLRTNIIAGVLPENLVTMNNLQPIPNCSFNYIQIMNDFHVEYINNQHFSDFINNRFLLNSNDDQVVTAAYYFNDMQLNGKTRMSSINDVLLEDVVFDENNQVITSSKRFLKPIEIVGDVIIKDMNGYSIGDVYQKSIMLNKAANVSGNIHFKDVSQITGNIYAKNINGIPINSIHEILESSNSKIRADIMRDTITHIKETINFNIDVIKDLPEQYMYLERADKVQLEIENVTDAQIINVKDNLMIHVYIEDLGNKCGLPENCFCPHQKTVQITPKYALNIIENKLTQRVFSYQNDDMTVHLITNTKSKSSYCRNNNSILHEFTSLTWTLAPVENKTTPMYIYPERLNGYISDVKFFSFDGYVYAIVARFYDASLNTHNVDCLVLRFSKEKNEIEHIQKLSANGASILHVFHTAQGINLVIGNKPNLYYYYNLITVDLYQFDANTKMFNLLRQIPTTGCVSINSVVLGYESFIILATIKAPLQIFKYHPTYNNYYIYQSLTFSNYIQSLAVFYTGGAGIGDAYLAVVGDEGHFYIFSYKYLIGWKMESEGDISGLRKFVPFTLQKTQYLFALSSLKSSLLTIVKHGLR